MLSNSYERKSRVEGAIKVLEYHLGSIWKWQFQNNFMAQLANEDITFETARELDSSQRWFYYCT